MTPVYLHGAGHHRGLWAPFVDGVCLDLPGHGRAPRVTPPSVQAYAKALLPALPQEPVLIGHSLGGMVSVELAGLLGERLRALILLDAPIKFPFSDLRRSVQTITQLTDPELISGMVGMRISNPATRRAVRRAVSDMTPGGLRDAALAASFYDARPVLRRITRPVFGLYARTSVLGGPIAAHVLRMACPHVRIEMVGGGHLFPQGDREATNRRITAILESL